MIEINRDSLEGRILATLLTKYPVTASELRKMLKVREHTLNKSLAELVQRGIIGKDILSDKVYLRLLREDISFVGLKPKQKRGIVKKAEKKKTAEYSGMMYR
jgi:DNA-binding Lrp family transcriptional regulator